MTYSATQIAAATGLPAPTPAQVQIIEAPLAPAAIVAGAGSGKTETMAQRVVWLVLNGLVPAREVLGLTFTRKGARELAERVSNRLLVATSKFGIDFDPGVDIPTFDTYNAFAHGIVTEHGLRLGIDPSAQVNTPARQWQLMHELIASWPGDLETDNAVSTLVEAGLRLAGEMDEHLVDPDELHQTLVDLIEPLAAFTDGTKGALDAARGTVGVLSTTDRLIEVVAAYRQLKRDTNSVDYSDQVATAVRLVRRFPQVAETLRKRYPVVLLDEFQDTSFAQLELLARLFAVPGAAVMAVGDPKQAIYGWRGASARALAQFGSEFRTAQGDPATRYTLTTSWRNDRAILAAANAVAAELSDVDDDAVLTARPEAPAGELQVRGLVDRFDEAEHVATWIAERVGQLGPTATAAVLCRKKSLFPLMADALRHCGLDVEIIGVGGLLDQPAVRHVIGLLRAAVDPGHGRALSRILTADGIELSPGDLGTLGRIRSLLSDKDQREVEGVGDVTLTEAIAAITSESTVASIPAHLRGPVEEAKRNFSPAGMERLNRIGRLLNRARGRSHVGLADQVEAAIRDFGLDIELATAAVASGAEAALAGLIDEAAAFENSGGRTMVAFLDWLDAAHAREDGLELAIEPRPGAVQILTIHAAKGLEWDIVAIPAVSEEDFTDPKIVTGGIRRDNGFLAKRGSIPHSLRGDREFLPPYEPAPELDAAGYAKYKAEFAQANGASRFEENRRLAYVAITRARAHLLTTHAWWRHQVRSRVMAPYLEEILPDPKQREAAGLGGVPARPEQADEAATPEYPRVRTGSVKERAAELARAAVGVGTVDASAAIATGVADAPGAEVASASATIAELSELVRIFTTPSPRQQVAAPAAVPISALPAALADPSSYRRHIARPVPQPTSQWQREGTRLHAWIERYYRSGALTLFDATDDLAPGQPLADTVTSSDEADAMENAIANFQASRFATMEPILLEEPFAVPVAGVVLRGRIDAVFMEGDRHLIVDWKSGRQPQGEAMVRATAQLGAYRIAYQKATGIPLEQIEAAFFYLATGTEVKPVDYPDLDQIVARLTSVDFVT